MSAEWVAGGVRARAIARRRVGAGTARDLAAAPSLDAALRALAAGPSDRGTRPGQTLPAAQHAVAATLLWDLRVLAGWLPTDGGRLMRPLAGWFEIANADELLAGLLGRPVGEFFELGALATAWPRLRDAASPAELRHTLATSAWKDPGGDSERALRVGMRASWAERVAALGGHARDWAASGVALLLAGESCVTGGAPPPMLRGVAARLLGASVAAAASPGDIADRLPGRLGWVLDGAAGPTDLWRAETAWWRRIEKDGLALLRAPGSGTGPVLGAAAVLAADSWRLRAALEIAARGGEPLEAYDAVA